MKTVSCSCGLAWKKNDVIRTFGLRDVRCPECNSVIRVVHVEDLGTFEPKFDVDPEILEAAVARFDLPGRLSEPLAPITEHTPLWKMGTFTQYTGER